jgi:hypothetical protein
VNNGVGGGGGGGGGGGKMLNVKTRQEMNANEAHLADLFANRDDGQDTFGNIGALRYVWQFCLMFWCGVLRGEGGDFLVGWHNRLFFLLILVPEEDFFLPGVICCVV